MKRNLISLAVISTITLSSLAAANDCEVANWQTDSVYTKGDKTSLNDRVYEASWWNQGQSPATNSGDWKVWKQINNCDQTDENLIEIDLLSPTNNSQYVAGDVITLLANAVSNTNPLDKVVFKMGKDIIAEDAVAPYEANWVADKTGTFTITATAFDQQGLSSDPAQATIAVTESDVIVTPPDSNFKIVGYFPSWQGSVSSIQFDKLTHINYSFLQPNADGSLKPLQGLTKFQQLIQSAKNTDTKIGIAIGGWNDGDDSAFEIFAGTAQGRTTFVNNVMAFVDQYDVDGVDMDWEYPDPGTSATNYALLMKQLSTALHAKNKYLSAAVVALGYTGGGVLRSVFDDVDFLNLMAYDANNSDHANYQYALNSMNYWQGRGLAKEKTVIGVPFYSRPTWKAYKTLVAENAANACRDTDGSSYYNGIPTIRAKAKLAVDNAGGIMNWELSHDTQGTHSLLTAKWEVVKGLPASYDCGDSGNGGGTDGGNGGDNGDNATKLCADININPTNYNSYPNWPQANWAGQPSHAASGDHLIYNSAVYKANWWTMSQPGTDESWLLICQF